MTGHTLGTVALDALMLALGVLWLVTPTVRRTTLSEPRPDGEGHSDPGSVSGLGSLSVVLGERASARRRQRKGADGSFLGPLAEHDPKSNAPGASWTEATPGATTTGG